MNEIEINRIIAILKPSGLLSLNCNMKKDIAHKLFEDNNDRIEILKWLISQYSENYSVDIQNSHNIEHELVRKLSVLGFVEDSTKWPFIKGEMGKEEQIKIYNKIFRSLELLKSNHEPHYLEEDKEINRLLGDEFIYNKHSFVPNKGDHRKNKMIDFDVTKAKETLKKCDDILASVRKTLEYEEPRFNVAMVPSTKVNTDSLKNAFDSASPFLYEKQNSLSGNTSRIKLDAAIVGELYSSLQLITKVISPTSESVIVKAVDSKKTLLGIENIQKKSLIF